MYAIDTQLSASGLGVQDHSGDAGQGGGVVEHVLSTDGDASPKPGSRGSQRFSPERS